MHPTVLSSPLSKMRSVEYTSQSQPDFMVPVVTLEPVVLHCWWCQFLIWHKISPACWDGQWCTGLLWNIKLTLAIKHSHALRFMAKYKCTCKKKAAFSWSAFISKRESLQIWTPTVSVETSSIGLTMGSATRTQTRTINHNSARPCPCQSQSPPFSTRR